MEEHGHPTELYNEMIHGSGVGVFATWYGACWALIEAFRVVTEETHGRVIRRAPGSA